MSESETGIDGQLRLSLSQAGETGEISVIRCDGVLDTLTSGNLDSIIVSLMERDRLRIICDLGGVSYVSSAGWGVFVAHLRDLRDRSGDIKLVRMAVEVMEIFELLEFDGLLEHYEAVDRAVRGFGVGGNGHGPAVPAGEARRVDSTSQSTAALQDQAATLRPARDDKEAVLQLVWEDPFYSLSEMKTRLRETGEFKVGKWRIYRILRQKGLSSRRKRLRFVRRSLRTGQGVVG